MTSPFGPAPAISFEKGREEEKKNQEKHNKKQMTMEFRFFLLFLLFVVSSRSYVLIGQSRNFMFPSFFSGMVTETRPTTYDRSQLNLAATAKGFGSSSSSNSAGSSSSTDASSSSSSSSKSNFLEWEKKKSSKGGFAAAAKQVKVVDATSPCPCGSGNTYGQCCQQLHEGQGQQRYRDPESVTRARYTAFAVGLPSYLIDSTHSTQRDHARHSEGNLDGRKARKAWEKELVSKNSEVFEFLKLELIPRDEVDFQANNVTLLEGQEAVSYRILVRKRVDGGLINYQETAIYVPRPIDHVPLGDTSTSSTSGNNSKKIKYGEGINEANVGSYGWLYSHGIVTAVPEAIEKRLKAEAPTYQPDATIRDKW